MKSPPPPRRSSYSQSKKVLHYLHQTIKTRSNLLEKNSYSSSLLVPLLFSVFSMTLYLEVLFSGFCFSNDNLIYVRYFMLFSLISSSLTLKALSKDYKYNLLFYPLKASFYIPENTPNFSTTGGFRRKILMKLVYQYMAILHPLQLIFIHYKSRIAAAIRGL